MVKHGRGNSEQSGAGGGSGRCRHIDGMAVGHGT